MKWSSSVASLKEDNSSLSKHVGLSQTLLNTNNARTISLQ
jgi:hypothetical protein